MVSTIDEGLLQVADLMVVPSMEVGVVPKNFRPVTVVTR